MKRPYLDPPDAERCVATITLKDGSTARCGRRRRHSKTDRCYQHPAQPEAKETPSEGAAEFRGLPVMFLDYDARREPKTSFSCVKCQKDLKPGQKYRRVLMFSGEPFVIHPKDSERATDTEWHFIGADCAKQLGLEWTHPPEVASVEARAIERAQLTPEALALLGPLRKASRDANKP